MEIYEFDLVALIVFCLGSYVLTKNELEVTLSAGPTKFDGMVDDSSKYTKSQKVKLGRVQTKIFGCALIASSFLIYATIQGDLAFVL